MDFLRSRQGCEQTFYGYRTAGGSPHESPEEGLIFPVYVIQLLCLTIATATGALMGGETARPWLLLIHQIPPKPDYLRVKIWRRLHQVGAVAIKQSVYALPQSDQALEDFSWILKEIMAGGGDGSVSETLFLEGLTDAQVVGLFQAARNADYEKIVEDARSLADGLSGDSSGGNDGDSKLKSHFSRLRRRFEEIVALDFFDAPGAGAAEGALADVGARIAGVAQRPRQAFLPIRELKGRTWVTRKGVYVDRIACAWLVRRFLDPGARFKFVSGKPYQGKSNEIRFDMFEAEYTHEGDRCTFEVMVDRLGLDDYGLSQVAQIIHDMDLKDRKFHRPEVDGLGLLFDGITAASIGDGERLERGFVILDEMYASLSKQTQKKSEVNHAPYRQAHAKEQRKNRKGLPGDSRMDR